MPSSKNQTGRWFHEFRQGQHTCSECRQTQDLKNFYIQPKTQRVHNLCHPCRSMYMTAYRYGITLEAYKSYLKRAKVEGCAICRKLCEAYVMDHDHKTGKLRSLICRECNTLIGLAKEDTKTLSEAICYLATWRMKNKLTKATGEDCARRERDKEIEGDRHRERKRKVFKRKAKNSTRAKDLVSKYTKKVEPK